MTTEPKDVRGGDFAKQNEPKTPSDPPPVREAVAWRRQLSEIDGHFTYSNVGGEGWQPLYAAPVALADARLATQSAVVEWLAPYKQEYRAPHDRLCDLLADRFATPNPLPVMEALEHLRECVKLVPAPGAIEAAERFLALTGETSRE